VDAGFEAWKAEQMAKLAAAGISSSSRPGASALAPLGSPPAGSSSRGLGVGSSSGAAAADAGRGGYSSAAANRLTGRIVSSVAAWLPVQASHNTYHLPFSCRVRGLQRACGPGCDCTLLNAWVNSQH
jgi:hypothetical protein